MRKFFPIRSTRSIARDRLKILLISDRVNCSRQMMELMKKDIARVLAKYMRIDEARMKIQMEQVSRRENRSEKMTVLYIHTPVLDLHQKEGSYEKEVQIQRL